MHQKKYFNKYKAERKENKRKNRAVIFLLSLLLVLTVSVGGTVAYLFTQTDPVENVFKPAHVNCEVTENFYGTTKENINVKNTGDTDAYIRVNLVTYRVNDAGQRIGGTATIPAFALGTGWVLYGGYYYYTLPVAAGESPAANLASSITLQAYNDADGGWQAIDVMAEAIQSNPVEAVGTAWGVTISNGAVSAYN